MSWISEPTNFNDALVRRGDPKIWTLGIRVDISWDSQELAADQPVTVEIINLFEEQDGIKVNSNITVVNEQPNTGKAVFDLPKR